MTDRSVVIPKGMQVQYDEWQLAPAVRVGNRLYCSGQLGLAADGIIPDSAEAQFVNAFEAVKAVLEEAGGSFANVEALRLRFRALISGRIDALRSVGGFRDRF